MQVILLERVEKLGQMGQMVDVKQGYARNFLLPKKKALRATKDNVAYFEKQKTTLEANNLARRKDAEYVSEQMKDVTVMLIRQASETGVLYGSIRGRDIGEALKTAGYDVDKNQVQLINPIKDLGLHRVRVSLHPEVSIEVTVNVAQSEEEAKVQANQEA
ncbi:MAG: 50S ribosomal protein L9 [Proteobacteria bacterium]|nr:50S ribosomal protein L9 [Pseudomonadota bacterium]